MKMSDLVATVSGFRNDLAEVRSGIPDVPWYPYGSLSNVYHLESFIDGDTEIVPKGGSVIDVGAADGDLGFLFHSLGSHVDFLDNGPTNFNQCRAIRATQKALGHTGRLIEIDIDLGFELDRDYDLAIFLGALYHLRNPALPLIRLAQHCQRMLISTRITSHLPSGEDVSMSPVGYLLNAAEANNDPTNWWILSREGLTRLLKRCGWNVISMTTVGAVGRSNPVDNNADERAFAYCERVPNHADLFVHHHF
jgi:hypothetical protein